jgi:hypothetical protein
MINMDYPIYWMINMDYPIYWMINMDYPIYWMINMDYPIYQMIDMDILFGDLLLYYTYVVDNIFIFIKKIDSVVEDKD